MINKRALLLFTAHTAPAWFASGLHNPIFIIGCGRSGTTILSHWLDNHYDIANLSEANDIWDPEGYPWSESPRGRNAPPTWIDPYAHAEYWWQNNQQRGKEIRSIFGAFEMIRRGTVFVNKTPLNTFRIPYLVQMFPDARFIHIVRDGRAVAYSYAKKQYDDIQKHIEAYREHGYDYSFEKLLIQLAGYWQLTVQEVVKQNERCKLTEAQKLLEVRYEDLCADPSAVMKTLCQFMGIETRRFKPQAWKITMKNQNEKWRTELSAELISAVQSAEEPALRHWGYL